MTISFWGEDQRKTTLRTTLTVTCTILHPSSGGISLWICTSICILQIMLSVECSDLILCLLVATDFGGRFDLSSDRLRSSRGRWGFLLDCLVSLAYVWTSISEEIGLQSHYFISFLSNTTQWITTSPRNKFKPALSHSDLGSKVLCLKLSLQLPLTKGQIKALTALLSHSNTIF